MLMPNFDKLRKAQDAVYKGLDEAVEKLYASGAMLCDKKDAGEILPYVYFDTKGYIRASLGEPPGTGGCGKEIFKSKVINSVEGIDFEKMAGALVKQVNYLKVKRQRFDKIWDFVKEKNEQYGTKLLSYDACDKYHINLRDLSVEKIDLILGFLKEKGLI